MTDKPPTSVGSLIRAREIALSKGLKFVYTGNVHDSERGSTWCPGCGKLLVERDWFRLGQWNLSDGACKFCGERIPGVFDETPGDWGPRRRPVVLSELGLESF
jgi:pyruvate formate lyase activating enzyme